VDCPAAGHGLLGDLEDRQPGAAVLTALVGRLHEIENLDREQ
jgi:hypothetical protein